MQPSAGTVIGRRTAAPATRAADATRDEHPVETFTVLVAVLTFKRPDDITDLAPQLVRHAAEAAGTAYDGGAFRVDVLVVDNDPEAGARQLVQPLPGVRYVHEPRPGIAAARNRALAEGHAADLLVFIDDDERPLDDWLTALLRTWLADRPAAVSGHVLSVLPDDVDPWILAGDLFHRPNPPTGTILRTLAAGNLLLDLRQVRAWGLRFDDRFGLTGGEDTLFTRQIDAAGGRMLWCRESVTTDRVPRERLSRSWLASRFFRFGVTSAQVELTLLGPGGRQWAMRARCVGRGVPRVIIGGTRWLLGRMSGRLPDQARGCKTFMRGAGLVAGGFGHTRAEYARTGESQ